MAEGSVFDVKSDVWSINKGNSSIVPNTQRVSVLHGGYCIVGKFVVVDICFKALTTLSNGTWPLVSGFPRPALNDGTPDNDYPVLPATKDIYTLANFRMFQDAVQGTLQILGTMQANSIYSIYGIYLIS